MGHAFRETAKGDLVELKRALYELQQQYNDRVEAGKLLHTENHRLKQHIKGLWTRLLSTASISPNLSVSEGTRTTSSWSSRLAFPTAGGMLRNSTVGEASALRTFKQAAAQATLCATEAVSELHSTREQLQQTQQQLQKLLVKQEQLQSEHAATQQMFASSAVDNTALQDQVQRMQQVCQSQQQAKTILQQQLQQQSAQQQVLQEAHIAAHEEELQNLQAAYQTELNALKETLQTQHSQVLDAAQQQMYKQMAHLEQVKHVMRKLAQLEQGHPTGWTDQLVCHAAQPSSSSALRQLQVRGSQLDKPLALQVLLYSLSSQPGLLGISKRDWWPLLLIHAHTAGACQGTAVSQQLPGQLLAAVAARPAVPMCNADNVTAQQAASAACQGGSDSENHSASSGDVLHHQLQLQLPAQLDSECLQWMKAGKLQLSLINAKPAVVGAFMMPVGSEADRLMSMELSGVEGAQSEPVAQVVLAVLLPTDTTCRCWVVGLYKRCMDHQPGIFLGYLSAYAGLSSSNSSNSKTPPSGLPWSTRAGWRYPDLPSGEFLVPVAEESALLALDTSSLSANVIKQQCSLLYMAALRSGLFQKTSKLVVLECADGNSQDQVNVPCEVWTLESAATRADITNLVIGQANNGVPTGCKDCTAGADPWLAAGAVYGTAILDVNLAATVTSASELVATSRPHLLDVHDSLCADSSNVDGGAKGEQQLMHVGLTHSRGKSAAELQVIIRYNQPAAGALQRYEDLQQLEANHKQHVDGLESHICDQQLKLQEHQHQVHELELSLTRVQGDVSMLELKLTQLQSDTAVKQEHSELELTQLKLQQAQVESQHAAQTTAQQRKMEHLQVENEQLQRLIEQHTIPYHTTWPRRGTPEEPT